MLLSIVPDAIKRSDEIVRHDERTVVQLRYIDWTTQVIAIVVPPFGKGLGFPSDVTIILEVSHHHPSPDRHSSIPRTMLRRKDRALILFRKHVTCVEHEAEVCGMSGLLYFREHHIRRWRIGLVLVSAHFAAAIPR